MSIIVRCPACGIEIDFEDTEAAIGHMNTDDTAHKSLKEDAQLRYTMDQFGPIIQSTARRNN